MVDTETPQQEGSAALFWIKIAFGYIIIQAILGFLIFEHFWAQTKQYRQPGQEKIHEKFPMYRRYDHPSKWTKSMFYPGALFFMPTRLFLILGMFFLGAFFCHACSWGHDFSKGPITGFKRHIYYGGVRFLLTFIIFVAGMKVERKQMKVDYKEYLGQDYQIRMKKPKHTSTVVSNHVSWLDGHILLNKIGIAIAPDASFASAPILGQCLKALDCVFMPRAKSEADKDKALQSIKKRQEDIEEEGKYPPLLIFAEGGTSNGTHLMSFKKGAFYFEKTITPVVLKYTFDGFTTDYALFDSGPLVILTLCWIWGGLKCEMMVMPDFQPTEYMYKTYADKGKERWEAYAWCLRDVMAKTSGLKITDIPNRAKLAYWKHLNGKSGIEDFENKTVEQICEEFTKVLADLNSKKNK